MNIDLQPTPFEVKLLQADRDSQTTISQCHQEIWFPFSKEWETQSDDLSAQETDHPRKTQLSGASFIGTTDTRLQTV